MNKKVFVSLFVSVVSIVGCNAGNAAEGPSTTEMNNTWNSLPMEKKIDMINHSPDSPARKKQRIDELKSGAGQK